MQTNNLENIISIITQMNNGENGELAKELAEIQGQLKGLKKNKVANGISFLNTDKVLDHIQPLLTKAGILLHTSMVPGTSKVTPRMITTKKGDQKLKYEYEALAHFEFIKEYKTPTEDTSYNNEKTNASDLICSYSNGYTRTQRIQGFYTVYGDQFDDTAKAKGTAETYSERYFLLKYFKIATDKDDADAKVSVEIKEETTTAAVAAVKKVVAEAPKAAPQPVVPQAPKLSGPLTQAESEASQKLLKDYIVNNNIRESADQMAIMKKINDAGYKKAGEVPLAKMKEILGGL